MDDFGSRNVGKFLSVLSDSDPFDSEISFFCS